MPKPIGFLEDLDEAGVGNVADSLLEDFPCENLRIELRQAVESYTARLDSEIERVRAAVTGSSISPGRIASLTNASQVFGFLAYEVW
jgi:hypothetical protein